jgi:hypothetical protein
VAEESPAGGRGNIDPKIEPTELADLIVQRAEERGMILGDKRFRSFVEYRWQRPFQYGFKWGRWYGLAFSALSLLAIAAGLGSSAIVTAGGEGGWWTVVVAVLGLVVGVSAAVNQIWRPAQRSVARHQSVNALRREGWDFVCDRGRYKDKWGTEGVDLFIDEIGRILRPVEAIDEEASDAPAQN